MKKPINPTIHGINDYVFAGIQLAVPRMLGINPTATEIHTALGANFGLVNALTDTVVGIKPILSFKTHQKLDAGFLGGLALLTLLPSIRKEKKALAFHLGFLALAITHYILTDYND